jgi:hypothetical protein
VVEIDWTARRCSGLVVVVTYRYHWADRGRLERRAVAIFWALHFQYSPDWWGKLRDAIELKPGLRATWRGGSAGSHWPYVSRRFGRLKPALRIEAGRPARNGLTCRGGSAGSHRPYVSRRFGPLKPALRIEAVRPARTGPTWRGGSAGSHRPYVSRRFGRLAPALRVEA